MESAADPVPKKPRKSAAAKAREAEAAADSVVIEQCGVKLRIPIGNIPIGAIDAARDGDNYGSVKALIGEEQWKALSDAGAGARDVGELGDKIAEAAGGN
jgi:hypothetical protein